MRIMAGPYRLAMFLGICGGSISLAVPSSTAVSTIALHRIRARAGLGGRRGLQTHSNEYWHIPQDYQQRKPPGEKRSYPDSFDLAVNNDIDDLAANAETSTDSSSNEMTASSGSTVNLEDQETVSSELVSTGSTDEDAATTYETTIVIETFADESTVEIATTKEETADECSSNKIKGKSSTRNVSRSKGSQRGVRGSKGRRRKGCSRDKSKGSGSGPHREYPPEMENVSETAKESTVSSLSSDDKKEHDPHREYPPELESAPEPTAEAPTSTFSSEENKENEAYKKSSTEDEGDDDYYSTPLPANRPSSSPSTEPFTPDASYKRSSREDKEDDDGYYSTPLPVKRPSSSPSSELFTPEESYYKNSTDDEQEVESDYSPPLPPKRPSSAPSSSDSPSTACPSVAPSNTPGIVEAAQALLGDNYTAAGNATYWFIPENQTISRTIQQPTISGVTTPSKNGNKEDNTHAAQEFTASGYAAKSNDSNKKDKNQAGLAISGSLAVVLFLVFAVLVARTRKSRQQSVGVEENVTKEHSETDTLVAANLRPEAEAGGMTEENHDASALGGYRLF